MMKKYMILKILLPVMILTLVLGCASRATVKSTAAADDLPVITDIKPEDNSLAITSNKSFVYTIYAGNDPYKVTVDIPDMRIGGFTGKIVSSKKGISEIVPQQTDSPNPSVKIDVTLQAPSSVVPLYKDNTLTLLVKPEEPVTLTQGKETEEKVETKDVPDTAAPSDSAAAKVGEEKSSSGEPEEAQPAENRKEVLAKATTIDRIELEKSPAGLRVLIIGNGTMMPNVFPLDQKVVIDIPNVSLHASLPSKAVSPLAGIRAGRHKDKVRLVLDLKAKTAFDVAAVGNTIEILLKNKEIAASQPRMETHPKETARHEAIAVAAEPRKEAALPSEQENQTDGSYKQKKISLDFQDADVGPIFRLLADVNNYNLVLDPGVKGKITIKLMNVPWDQALDIVSRQSNLAYRIDHNILYVAPTSVFERLAKDQAKMQQAQEETEPLMQEIVRVNYATAGEIQTAITSGKLLSPRGSITIDNRMNTLIVKDTQQSIDKVKDLVRIMDVAKPQVMIEAKLVEVDTDYSSQLGINWGGSFTSQTFPNNVGGAFSVNTPTITAGPSATLPGQGGGAVNLNLGHANTFNVSLSLSALESINKSKTLSNPKILTMDNEAATIQQGTTFFIPTVSQAGTQTQSQTATLSLQVTPKITPDGYVQLKVNATDNSLQPGTAGANAVVNTKSLTTQALVKAGETLVLGGIYRLDESETSNGVPLLSRIPGLGWLFKTKQQIGPTIKELLIFITPTIVSRPVEPM
ncbi:MAG: type IV pilus secretin PilQ [Nitrospiraceae bacterium]|nr:type IV pilus secretin PilQ [Nitrospiraceae bacterium]